MATTPQPLVWDFYRSVDNGLGIGSVIHYLDEESQSLYLNGGIATTVATIQNGGWEAAEQSEEIQITDDNFVDLRWDHPSNGILYGVATDGESLTFLRYIYGMDISNIADSWKWNAQSDNPITQFDAQLYNVDSGLFTAEASMFQPGAKLSLNVRVGDANPFPIGVIWLDESDYDQKSATVKISGRNSIGYFLKDQTFDDNTTFTGTANSNITAILEYGGITKFIIQESEHEHTFEFKPSDSLLNGIQDISTYYSPPNKWYKIEELPDGTVCVGYDYWIAEYIPKGYYSFHEGKDVFVRKTRRSVDGSYTQLRITGRDADGNDLTPITMPIESFSHWVLGKHRTKHISHPVKTTQEKLQEWAEAQAKALQYVGIVEEFTGPFRPHLLVGDVAEVIRGDVGVSLGVVTDVTHSFSRTNGFQTQFTVDSGGVATEGENYAIYSQSANVNGFNRRQGVVDLIRFLQG